MTGCVTEWRMLRICCRMVKRSLTEINLFQSELESLKALTAYGKVCTKGLLSWRHWAGIDSSTCTLQPAQCTQLSAPAAVQLLTMSWSRRSVCRLHTDADSANDVQSATASQLCGAKRGIIGWTDARGISNKMSETDNLVAPCCSHACDRGDTTWSSSSEPLRPSVPSDAEWSTISKTADTSDIVNMGSHQYPADFEHSP